MENAAPAAAVLRQIKRENGTRMNADFQDAIQPKMFFGAYQRKAASLSTEGSL
jgi:hypothetical protein